MAAFTLAPQQMLHRTVSELRRCLDIVSRVEDGVIPLISSPIHPDLRQALQDIDLLSQCIDDIARCLSGLAQAMGDTRGLDMAATLDTIKLQDMRTRLEGGVMDSRKVTQRQDIFVEF